MLLMEEPVKVRAEAPCFVFDNVGVPEPEMAGFSGTDYAVEVFRPGLLRVKPPSLPRWPFLGYWALHMLRVFRTRDYRIYLVRKGEEVVHFTAVIPKYFRFPFMQRGDVHIGPTWTDPDHRGRSIARVVLAVVLKDWAGRRCWYLAREANPASRSVAQRVGLRLMGRGRRIARFGLRSLGAYHIL